MDLLCVEYKEHLKIFNRKYNTNNSSKEYIFSYYDELTSLYTTIVNKFPTIRKYFTGKDITKVINAKHIEVIVMT